VVDMAPAMLPLRCSTRDFCWGLTASSGRSLLSGSSTLVKLIITGETGVDACWSAEGLAVLSSDCVGPLTVTLRFLGEGCALVTGLGSRGGSTAMAGNVGDPLGVSRSSSSLTRTVLGEWGQSSLAWWVRHALETAAMGRTHLSQLPCGGEVKNLPGNASCRCVCGRH